MNNINVILSSITILSLFSALAVITATNPVLSIVFLIFLFVNIAAYLILLGLNFIGISYLLVYVGAITVLFLFIVMMLSVETASLVETGTSYTKLLPLVYSIAILFLLLFTTLIPSFIIDFLPSFTIIGEDTYNININGSSIINESTFGDPSTLLHKDLQIQTIGQAIYGNYAILLILGGFLLLLAMVCPIILTRTDKTPTVGN